MRISDGIRQEQHRLVVQFKAGGERFYKAFPFVDYASQAEALEAARHFVESRRQLFEKKHVTVVVKNIHQVVKRLRGYTYLYLRLSYNRHERFVNVGSMDKYTIEQITQSKKYRDTLNALLVELESLKGE